jgi:acyl-coenzyme A synthetase/AMP-(fatty) acid ligase
MHALRIGAQVVIVDLLTISEDLEKLLDQVEPKAILIDIESVRRGKILEKHSTFHSHRQNYEGYLVSTSPRLQTLALEPYQGVAITTFRAGL